MQHSPQFKKHIAKAIDFGAKLKSTYNVKQSFKHSEQYIQAEKKPSNRRHSVEIQSPTKQRSPSPQLQKALAKQFFLMPKVRSRGSVLMAANKHKRDVRMPAERSMDQVNKLASGYGSEFFNLVNAVASRHKEDMLPESESLRHKKIEVKRSKIVKDFRSKFKGSQPHIRRQDSNDSYPDQIIDENTLDIVSRPIVMKKSTLRKQGSLISNIGPAKSISKKSATKMNRSEDGQMHLKVRRVAPIDPSLRAQESWLNLIRNQVRGQVSKEILKAAQMSKSSASIALDIQCSKDLFSPRIYGKLINQFKEVALLEDQQNNHKAATSMAEETGLSRVKRSYPSQSPSSFSNLAAYKMQQSYSNFYKQLMAESIESLLAEAKTDPPKKTSSITKANQHLDLVPKNIDSTRYCPKEILEEREASNTRSCLALSVIRRMRDISHQTYDGSDNYDRLLKAIKSKTRDNCK